jgi:hypothetical protein
LRKLPKARPKRTTKMAMSGVRGFLRYNCKVSAWRKRGRSWFKAGAARNPGSRNRDPGQPAATDALNRRLA